MTKTLTSPLFAAAAIIAVMALVFAIGLSTAMAAGPYNAIPDENPAFEASGLSSIENVNNPALRFGAGGRIAIPGMGGQHASDNSAVAPYSTGGSNSIVDPQGF